MLATLVVLTLLFVVATTGASYYGFINDDDNNNNNVNPFLADMGGSSEGFLKSSANEMNKSWHRHRPMKMINKQDGRSFNDKDLKAWNKINEIKNKNKTPKNKNSKNSKHLHIVTHSPQNDEPIKNSRKMQLTKMMDERVKFMQSMDNNAQQMSDSFRLQNPRFPPSAQNHQDFFYYPPPHPGFYNLPQFPDRPNYQSMPAAYQRALLPYLSFPHHIPYPPDQQKSRFTTEGEKISMALVKAIMDYLKATGDTKGLAKVVQALAAFNEIFTSPTYYGPLMDGYKKFLDKISAQSFLKSLDDEHQANMPRTNDENIKKLEFEKFDQRTHLMNNLKNFEKKSEVNGKMIHGEDKLFMAIGEYLSSKRSTIVPKTDKKKLQN